MAVSQCVSIIWSAAGGLRKRYAACLLLSRIAGNDGRPDMASKPTTRITREMQQIISEMIARMSLRG